MSRSSSTSGAEFTRLIFMRGEHFHQFAPIIGEGYDSPNLQNTVYSRLLLEQDNLAIPHIRRIILAGECEADRASRSS